MKVRVFQIFFKSDGHNGLMPVDGELHALAVKYAAENMNYPIDFTSYKHSWVACEVNEEDKPIRALGILGMQLRADFTLCRFANSAAVVKLIQRGNDILHDMYGGRGNHALVHLPADELPEHHCPNRDDWMRAFGLKPADRWTFLIQ